MDYKLQYILYNLVHTHISTVLAQETMPYFSYLITFYHISVTLSRGMKRPSAADLEADLNENELEIEAVRRAISSAKYESKGND